MRAKTKKTDMRLGPYEYIVSKRGVPDESITITKEALEKWRDRYLYMTMRFDEEVPRLNEDFYAGKADALIDLLKHFK